MEGTSRLIPNNLSRHDSSRLGRVRVCAGTNSPSLRITLQRWG